MNEPPFFCNFFSILSIEVDSVDFDREPASTQHAIIGHDEQQENPIN